MAYFKKHLILAASIAALVPAGSALAQENTQEAPWQTRCGGPSRAAETLICEASCEF